MNRAWATCRRHRPVLVDLVDHGERGPATAAALDHLAACPPCERELTELALVAAALRRAGSAYRSLEVSAAPSDPPRTLAAAARRRPSSWRLHLGGLVTSAGIAALLVAPRIGSPPPPRLADPAVQQPAAVVSWQAVEHRLATSPDLAPVATLRSFPPRYPEGLARPWKEVPSTDAAAREFKAS